MTECTTVNCYEIATTVLEITSEYESITGRTKTNVFEMGYCDEHADMWLSLDGVADTYYEVVEND